MRAQRVLPSPRPRCSQPVESIEPNLRKEQATCCNAKRDSQGRLPIGYCGPTCERRPK